MLLYALTRYFGDLRSVKRYRWLNAVFRSGHSQWERL